MTRIPLVIVLVTVLSAPGAAQSRVPDAINRGSWLVAGSASASRNNSSVEGRDDDRGVTVVELQPALLYFVAPRIALGGRLALARLSFDGGSSTSWSVGPSARYYFAGSSAKVLSYVGGGVALSRSDLNIGNGNSEPSTGTSVEALAGITWLFTRQVGFVSEAAFQRSSRGENTSSGGDVDVVDTIFGLRFGFAAFIPRGR